MENPTVSGLRSRSRSKTPFLRSSCDRENCTEGEDHVHHKSGRKTPIKRSTPVKQLGQTSSKVTTEAIAETEEEHAPSHRTRQSTRLTEKLVKTSDYSSEESLDRLKGSRKEIFQNELNSQYERVSTSSHYRTLADVTLSPISQNVTRDRSFRFGSPAYSACSTDSSFAEQALADTSALLDRDPSAEHLPYRLYKMAGEYWNKYPKTDYTYSPLSKDRVELAPGQVAVPNMSRRSLSQFRVQGPLTSSDEVDRLAATWTSSATRKRFTVSFSSPCLLNLDAHSVRSTACQPHPVVASSRRAVAEACRLVIAYTWPKDVHCINPKDLHFVISPLDRRKLSKYPKTDYTYSPLSKDRVELAPGQVAVPNMSRRSLSQFRVQGPLTSSDEVDRLAATWTSSATRKRFTTVDSSDDEGAYLRGNGAYQQAEQRWWITRLLVTIITTITSSTSSAYRRLVGPSHRYPYTDRRPAKALVDHPPARLITTITSSTSSAYRRLVEPSHRYPYTDRRPAKAGIATRAAAAAVAPFYWIYTIIKTVVTTTITTVTETLTPNHVSESAKYSAAYKEKATKRRWWPWLLLLLLPAVGYGCYNYSDQIWPKEETVIESTYKSPQISQDPDLSRRMAALEDWALNVDSKLKTFDQRLSKFDNLEAQIESYSFRHLQQNLIQILSTNDNTEILAAKLKAQFDRDYVTKEQMQTMSQEIHERLITSWKPDLDEDKIRRLIQEYLVVFERQQMALLAEKVREYVKEVEIHHHHSGSDFDAEAVKKIVAAMLNVYDADKTGLVDYALESAGGQVISTKCTELYQIKTKQYSVLGLPVWWVYTSPRFALTPGAMPAECWAFQGFPGYLAAQIKTKQYSVLGLPVWWVYTSPRFALTPGAMPAECWAFQGFPGYLVIRTYAIIEVTGFSLEHMSRLLAVDGKIESAPKNFSVYGLHGEMDPEPHLFGDYMYDANGTAIQYFPVKYPKTTNIGGNEYPVAFDIVELRVESNHGNPTYTCVYRFRVHGNPLSDIRMATDDSIKDSET